MLTADLYGRLYSFDALQHNLYIILDHEKDYD